MRRIMSFVLASVISFQLLATPVYGRNIHSEYKAYLHTQVLTLR